MLKGTRPKRNCCLDKISLVGNFESLKGIILSQIYIKREKNIPDSEEKNLCLPVFYHFSWNILWSNLQEKFLVPKVS